MAKPASNLVISPSDDDTSENDEFADFLFTNKVTQVNAIDESSNSSTAEYTQLVSVSVTNINVSLCLRVQNCVGKY